MSVHGRLCLVLLEKIQPNNFRLRDFNIHHTLGTLGVVADSPHLPDIFREIEGEFDIVITDKERRRLYRASLSTFVWFIECRMARKGKAKESVEG